VQQHPVILPDRLCSDVGAMAARPEDVQATFCATLVDEWARCGVRHAVVAPGSRSTPLALALADEGRIRLHVHHDERSAGFLALGLALEALVPTVVLTTSGTAAVELHPAVVEAHLSRVPLLVCTADRPPELRDVGAPQAIDQTHLYGRAARWFHDPGVPHSGGAGRWRALAARSHVEATGGSGPVHLNLPFREPLVGERGPLPPARPDGAAWAGQPAAEGPVDPGVGIDALAGRRGVVLAGRGSGDAGALERVAGALGWPVLADARAAARRPSPVVVAHPDAFLRDPEVAGALRPELVLRLGEPPASRVVGEWVAASGAEELVVAGPGRWLDPHATAHAVLAQDPEPVLAAWSARLGQQGEVGPAADGVWLERWRSVDQATAAALAEVLDATPGPTEPGLARALTAALPDGARLVLSSSMPVRDVEWYTAPRRSVRVHANRGANGIDGVVSTAVGVAAASGVPTALLVGDVAFLHDVNGLLGAQRRGADLLVVVVDNDGGGIFSFLPQAGVVGAERFEQLYGTPHGLDLVAVARAHGVPAEALDPGEDAGVAISRRLGAGGVRVLVARTDRAANVEVHRRLSDAAGRAARVALA
jgi:2-succinyl-5-enolpyruvyl-6-hydroxy-3-cyclohexene-1-carboxylate synthase